MSTSKHLFRAGTLAALVAAVAVGAHLLQRPPAHSTPIAAVATEHGTSLGFR